MTPKKTLSNWLTNRYQLVIRNDENFAERTNITFTYAKLFSLLFVAFVLILTLALYLSKSILAQWFDPLYEQAEVNRQLYKLVTAVDSLELEVQRREGFILNFQRVLNGEDSLEKPTNTDKSAAQKLAEANRETFTYKLANVDSQFRKQYELLDPGKINLRPLKVDDLPEMFFIQPLAGVVSSPFDISLGHFGVDVVSRSNEPIKCIADGTVIFSSWTMDAGYVVAVQHRNNLVSVYKHNSALLEKVGNFVNAGEIVAIIGNSGEMTNGPHLHFELWYNGNPVNPEDFVSF